MVHEAREKSQNFSSKMLFTTVEDLENWICRHVHSGKVIYHFQSSYLFSSIVRILIQLQESICMLKHEGKGNECASRHHSPGKSIPAHWCKLDFLVQKLKRNISAHMDLYNIYSTSLWIWMEFWHVGITEFRIFEQFWLIWMSVVHSLFLLK